jgi:hypothetical protein
VLDLIEELQNVWVSTAIEKLYLVSLSNSSSDLKTTIRLRRLNLLEIFLMLTISERENICSYLKEFMRPHFWDNQICSLHKDVCIINKMGIYSHSTIFSIQKKICGSAFLNWEKLTFCEPL